MTKQELQSYRKIQNEIWSIEYSIEELQAALENVASKPLSFTPHAHGVLDDRQAKLVEKKIALEERLIQKRDELIRKHEEIEQAIDSLEDIRERTVLRLRYIKGLRWEDICYSTGYEWAQTHRIHKRALNRVNRIKLKDDTQ